MKRFSRILAFSFAIPSLLAMSLVLTGASRTEAAASGLTLAEAWAAGGPPARVCWWAGGNPPPHPVGGGVIN